MVVVAAVVGIVVAAGAGVVWYSVSGAMHAMLDGLATGPLEVRPPQAAATPELVARRGEVVACGFEVVVDRELVLAGDEQRLVLGWRDDGTIAEISQRASGDGRVKMSLLTPLVPGSGLLATQDVYGLFTGPHELKQVFADAPAAELVAEHQRALDWLTGSGLAPHAFAAAQTLDLYTRVVRRGGAEHPRRALLFYRLGRAESEGRVFGDAGSIVDAPGTAAKVAAIRAAASDRFWES
jgi:hypothetical protein